MEWTIITLHTYKADSQFFANYEEHRSLNFEEFSRNNKPHTLSFSFSLFPLNVVTFLQDKRYYEYMKVKDPYYLELE